MIEVEKKFRIQPGDEEKLTTGATFIREVTMHDVYYDTTDYRLSLKNKCLRLRNKGFELKVATTAPAASQNRLGKAGLVGRAGNSFLGSTKVSRRNAGLPI